MERTKEGYYDTLSRSSQGWHEGKHDVVPWFEYFLGIMLHTAYREFEERMGLITTAKGAKTAMVLNAIRDMRRDFSIRDLQECCPTVGVDLIRRTLRLAREKGLVKCLGRGPEARWQKKW